MGFPLWVMRLMRFVADALGVLTICLVAALILLGLFCILYSIYFRSRILGQGLARLSYFSGPWIIRIALIFFAVWWGIGEILRLNLLRHKGRVLDASSKWQETLCKCYIVSNLGFAEPCLFLTLTFLLRASTQRSGTLGHKWNAKTAGFVLLYCIPMLALQLVVILIGPEYKKFHNPKLPSYFIKAAFTSKRDGDGDICTYPLFSTIFLGLFATILTAYLLWIGRRILHLVINKGLRKRVYALIFFICSLLPLRVVLLGLSVLSKPRQASFDAIVFVAFLSLLCCAGIGICLLVYLPIADSLSLRNLHRDLEARRRRHNEYDDMVSLMADQSPQDRSLLDSRNRDYPGAFVELSLFNPDQHFTPPDSPRPLGRPMISP